MSKKWFVWWEGLSIDWGELQKEGFIFTFWWGVLPFTVDAYSSYNKKVIVSKNRRKKTNLTINIKFFPRAKVAADRLSALEFCWAPVSSSVWGWSRIDGKSSSIQVKRYSIISPDLALSLFVPSIFPVRGAVHPTAQLRTLSGEHIRPRCDQLQPWKRNFWKRNRHISLFLISLYYILQHQIQSNP